MSFLHNRLDWVDRHVVCWLAQHSIAFLRIGLGVVYLWFGALKFIPGLSPAEDLALRTIEVLSLGLIPIGLSRLLLATLETVIGVGFITGRHMRLTLLLMAFQMVGALSPLVLFPGDVFSHVPLAPTLEGQYIIKNLVLIGAGMAIGSTLCGGRIVANPSRIRGLHEIRHALRPTPAPEGC